MKKQICTPRIYGTTFFFLAVLPLFSATLSRQAAAAGGPGNSKFNLLRSRHA